jgi:putative transcriptional regulator
MSKIGESLIKGANEALKYAQGKKIKAKVHKVVVPKHVDVRAIRIKLHLTRQEFANRYGFNIRTLEKWEQGTREPEGAVRAYLMVIDRNHNAVEAALSKRNNTNSTV